MHEIYDSGLKFKNYLPDRNGIEELIPVVRGRVVINATGMNYTTDSGDRIHSLMGQLGQCRKVL